MSGMGDPRIIVALDYAEPDEARALLRRLPAGSCRVKIGKELFVRGGPAIVEHCVRAGFPVFLDLKFHDIPNTVARACEAAAALGVWMVNVHVSGGMAMMAAAREALGGGASRPLLIGVTVLTSLNDADLAEIGYGTSAADTVQRLAQLAHRAGLDGVVCSAREATLLRGRLGKAFRLVTPGIRPAGAELGDQKRVLTPGDAIRAGSDYLVVGRPITAADDPVGSLLTIQREIDSALAH